MLTVINTTIGGTTLASASNPLQFSNILVAGNGGAGGNGGTAGKTLDHSSGGNGGVGGSVLGGGVFVSSGVANFTNDTILNNVANLVLTAFTGGAGGSPGDAAGSGTGVSGVQGANGAANGGGYDSQSATNNLGNSIIDLNAAGTNLNSTPPGTGPVVSTTPDVSGTFASQGDNLFGSETGGTGLVVSDQTGVTAAQLNIGPLQNNGGPTSTDGLLSGSTAIGAGNPALVASPPFSSPATDQRGSGFPRVINSLVDVGAFELQVPVITSLSPSSTPKGTAVTLTINGTGFLNTPNTTVTFAGISPP